MKDEACSIGANVFLKLVHPQKSENDENPVFRAEGQKVSATTLGMP